MTTETVGNLSNGGLLSATPADNHVVIKFASGDNGADQRFAILSLEEAYLFAEMVRQAAEREEIKPEIDRKGKRTL